MTQKKYPPLYMVSFQAGNGARRNVSFNPSRRDDVQRMRGSNPLLQVETIITDFSPSDWSIVPMKTSDGKKVFAIQYNNPLGAKHIVHIFESPV